MKRRDEGGFGRFMAGTAVLSGIGYSAYKSRSELSQFLKKTPNVINQTVAASQELTKFNTGFVSPPPTPAINDLPMRNFPTGGRGTVMSALGSSGLHKGVAQREIAESAFQGLLSSKTVSTLDAENAFRNILRANSPTEAYDLSRAALSKFGGSSKVFLSALDNSVGSGVYSAGRLADLQGSSILKGNLSPTKRAYLSGGAAKDKGLAFLGQLNTALGDRNVIGDTEFYSVAGKHPTRGNVVTPMMSTSIGGTRLVIPLENTGLTYYGENLSAQYVTRDIFNPATGGVTAYGDNYMNEVLLSASQTKTQREFKNRVHTMNVDMLAGMNDRDASARAKAIWTRPLESMSAGERALARLTTTQLASSTGKPFTPAEASKIFGESMGGGTQLWPWTSPQAQAVGTMSSVNLREDIYGPMGKWYSGGKNPLQPIRPWGVTEEAKAAAPGFKGAFGESWDRVDPKIKGPGYNKWLYGGEEAMSGKAYSTPQLGTMYIMEDAAGGYEGLRAAELGIVSPEGARMIESERTVHKSVILTSEHRMAPEIEAAFEAADDSYYALDKPYKGSAQYGTSAATGEMLSVDAGSKMSSEVIGVEKTGSGLGKVYLRERHTLTPGDFWKGFSPDSKDMIEVGRTSSVPGAQAMASATGQDIDLVLSGNRLGKNPYARNVQQMGALATIAGHKIDEGSFLKTDWNARATSQALINDPEKFFNVKELLANNQAGAELTLQRRMVTSARAMGFSTSELGLAFGAMPEELASKVFSPSELKEIFVPGRKIFGYSNWHLGDLASEGGAGGRGSIDPSGFRLLSMQGEAGQMMAADIQNRIVGEPGLRSADSMMASMLNQADPNLSLRQQFTQDYIDDLPSIKELNPEDFIKEKSYSVSIGSKIDEFGGSPRLYIPGYEELESLAPFESRKSASSTLIRSELEKGYARFIRTAKSPESTADDLNFAAKELRGTAQAAWAKEAVPGKKYLGSAYLTGISHSGDDLAHVSTGKARELFDELIEAAPDSSRAAWLKEQKGIALSGKDMTGMQMRFPVSGRYSAQFTGWKVDPDLPDELISLPSKKATLTLGGKTSQVDVSSLVGTSGDFDKDTFAFSVISNKETEAKVARQLSGKQAAEYDQYLFDFYVYRDKIKSQSANIAEMDMLTNLTSGYREATIAKSQTGQVNVALQKMKLAVSKAAPEAYDSLADVFFELESASIDAKHGAASGDLYKNIIDAAENNNRKSLRTAIGSLIGDEATTTVGELGGTQYTSHYDPEKTTDTIMDAMKATEGDVDSAHRISRMAKNAKPSDTLDDAVTLFHARSNSVDVGQALRQAEVYGEANFTQKTSAALQNANIKGSQLKGLFKKNKKALVIGGAIGAGIMLMSPSSSGAIPANREGPSGGMNHDPGEAAMYSGRSMAPPPPRIMESPKMYDIGSQRMSPYSSVSGRMSDASGNSEWINSVRQLGGDGGQVNVNIRDRRSHLDSYSLAQKIHERL